MWVGVEQRLAQRLAELGRRGRRSARPARCTMVRARVKPLLCTPLLAIPTTASPGRDVLPDQDAVERHRADAGADQVEAEAVARAVDHLAHLRDLAGRDVDAGRLGAGVEPLGELAEEGRIGLLHGDVVDHRDRPRADADDVVGVHRHAVDADGVVAAHLLRDQDLRADAVGGDRQAELGGERQDVGVVAERQQRLGRIEPEGLGHPAAEVAERRLVAPGWHHADGVVVERRTLR